MAARPEQGALRKLAHNSLISGRSINRTPHMIMTRPPFQPDTSSEIVESELQDMLKTIIEARCGLSAIHQVLDGALTMTEIRARYDQWKTTQCETRPGHSPADE